MTYLLISTSSVSFDSFENRSSFFYLIIDSDDINDWEGDTSWGSLSTPNYKAYLIKSTK